MWATRSQGKEISSLRFSINRCWQSDCVWHCLHTVSENGSRPNLGSIGSTSSSTIDSFPAKFQINRFLGPGFHDFFLVGHSQSVSKEVFHRSHTSGSQGLSRLSDCLSATTAAAAAAAAAAAVRSTTCIRLLGRKQVRFAPLSSRPSHRATHISTRHLQNKSRQRKRETEKKIKSLRRARASPRDIFLLPQLSHFSTSRCFWPPRGIKIRGRRRFFPAARSHPASRTSKSIHAPRPIRFVPSVSFLVAGNRRFILWPDTGRTICLRTTRRR